MGLNNQEERAAKAIKQAIDSWASDRGLPASPEHEGLALCIVKDCANLLRQPISKTTCLLADYDGNGGYKNGRLTELTGSVEEMLYSEDPVTGEPVEESVANAMLTLVHPGHLPEIC